MLNGSRLNLVVFCGAGFSTGVGVPTMNGFLDALRHSDFLEPTEQIELDRVVIACNSLASVIGQHAGNVEQLCSFLSLLQVIRPEFVFEGNVRVKTPTDAEILLRKAMAMIFGSPQLTAKNCRDVWSLASLSEQHNANIAFITTNYDAHIEMGCSHFRVVIDSDLSAARSMPLQVFANSTQKIWMPYSSSLVKSPKYSPSMQIMPYNNRRVSLCKLHGSITWSRGHNNTVEVIDQYIVPVDLHHTSVTTDSSAIDARLPVEAREWCKSGNVILVPPTVLKPNRLSIDHDDCESKILTCQWQSAAKHLRDADAVWFIGYSFPESDSFMRFFLGAALFDNPRLKQLVVIDPDRRAITERAKPLFASAGLRRLFRGLPIGWQSVRLPELLKDDIVEALRGATDGMRERRQIDEFVVYGDR